jgi:hypothetical protein
LFLGLLSGSIFLILITGIFNKFYLWNDWFYINSYLTEIFFEKETMSTIREYSARTFFYPIFSHGKISSLIEYMFIILGLGAIIPPVIYSFFHKRNFSRNSFWLILTIALVLANPYLYNCELIILLLPVLIFVNLMLIDRVQSKYIILILITFCVWIIFLFVLSTFILVQLFAVLLWFFILNGMLSVRVRSYTPKTFIGYWDDY